MGTPSEVDGIETRPLIVEVGVGEGEAIFVVGVGEGEACDEGVAVMAGNWLSPAAKTVKLRMIFCKIPFSSV